MPTVYTRSVGATGRDYATHDLAFAAVSTIVGSSDLVASDAQVIFDVYDDATFTSRSTWAQTYTCDATRNIIFRKAAGGGRPLLKPTSGTGHVVTTSQKFLVVEDHDVEQYASAGTSDECVRLGSGSSNAEGFTLARCKLTNIATTSQTDGIYAGNWSVGSATNPIKIQDCEIKGAQRALIHSQQFTTATVSQYWDIFNVTGANSAGWGFGYWVQGASSTIDVVAKNDLVVDCITAAFGSTSSPNNGTLTTTGSTNNFDEDGTFPGSGTPNPITATDSTTPGAGDWAIFANLTGYADLHLVDDADNDVAAGGVGPGSDSDISTTDLDGVTRSGATCEPGCYEIVSGGAHAITPQEITGGTPSIDSFSIGQTHAISPQEITAGVPVLESFTIAQDHAITPQEITSGAPALDSFAIAQIHAIAPQEITAGTPILDSFAIGQIHAIVPQDLTGGTPVLDSFAIGQIHAIVPQDLTGGTPSIDSFAIGTDGTHAITPQDLTGGAPILDSFTIGQIHAIVPQDLTGGTPILDSFAVTSGGVDAIVPQDLTGGTPVLDSFAIGQITAIAPQDLTGGIPILDSFTIGQIHAIVPQDLTGGTPVLDSFSLGSASLSCLSGFILIQPIEGGSVTLQPIEGGSISCSD